MLEAKLSRWAERNGKVVRWGNIIGGFCGQEFEETFETEKEAIERERQAINCEAIGDKRQPIATHRVRSH